MLISDLKVAILTEDGFEQAELAGPREMLEKAGIAVEVISPRIGEVKAWDKDSWGVRVKVDKHLNDVTPDEYDGLVLPGGEMCADELRMNPIVVDFVKRFFATGKPVAAIGHAPHILINSEVVEGRQMTSARSIHSDLINAGALWMDKDVIVDHGLITSRSVIDLEAFNKKLLEELREGVHQRTRTVG